MSDENAAAAQPTQKTNIPPPPRIIESLEAALEYIWQLYKAVALEPLVMSGAFTLSALETQAEIKVPVALTSANFHVTVQRTGATGTPAVDSDQVATITKSQTAFVVTFKAAPGVGAAISFDWILRRQ